MTLSGILSLPEEKEDACKNMYNMGEAIPDIIKLAARKLRKEHVQKKLCGSLELYSSFLFKGITRGVIAGIDMSQKNLVEANLVFA